MCVSMRARTATLRRSRRGPRGAHPRRFRGPDAKVGAMRTLTVCVTLAASLGFSFPAEKRAIEWPYYGSDQAGTKWSAAADINRANVASLDVAWTWKVGEKPRPEFRTQPGSFENTPLMIDNVLYISTPYNRVVALDAETGRERDAVGLF